MVPHQLLNSGQTHPCHLEEAGRGKAFSPMCDGAFYYLVVFNLKSLSCTIIDNRASNWLPGALLVRKYGYLTEVLIILHDHNLVRSAMKNEVERFNSMESDMKAQILLQASESRLERLT
ncbi:hypothetical protein L6452_08441 [Arctium lappa]|uniref:Uncharacterized protein n=1 Tax=Arctium lappa TaxID=4217 RepID=A0ACB9DHR2_ARCLA|nr:hypothetical protein L6452_08441 [Arctium lappa]